MSHELELVLDAKAILGEGPSWDDRKKELYWVDIEGKKIHVFDPTSKKHQIIQAAQHIGAVVPP